MITDFLEAALLKLTFDPKIMAIMIQTTIGLSIAVFLGQAFAFKKYIQLREPGYQLLSFFFTKMFAFLKNTIKSFGFILLTYGILLFVGYNLNENVFQSRYNFVAGAYVVSLIVFFGFGFSKERTRSLNENLITKNVE